MLMIAIGLIMDYIWKKPGKCKNMMLIKNSCDSDTMP